MSPSLRSGTSEDMDEDGNLLMHAKARLEHYTTRADRTSGCWWPRWLGGRSYHRCCTRSKHEYYVSAMIHFSTLAILLEMLEERNVPIPKGIAALVQRTDDELARMEAAGTEDEDMVPSTDPYTDLLQRRAYPPPQ